MEPMTMLALASTAMQAAGTMRQGQQEAENAKMTALGMKIQQRSIEQFGKQDEQDIRQRMLNAANSIASATASSGIMQTSGSVQNAISEVKRAGFNELVQSKSATKMRILESMTGQQVALSGAVERKRAAQMQAIGTAGMQAYQIGMNA